MEDATALAAAFQDADGIFILPPSEFDPAPGFPEARRVITAVMKAIEIARPKKVVCLSTIGAQATQPNLLTQRTLLEKALGTISVPVVFLRPAWFMENFAWDVASARDNGFIASFLQPLDKPVAMIATADIGRLAAQLILEEWQGVRVVELEAARRYTPNDVAEALGRIVGRPVKAEAVPRETWGSLFISQGMKDPIPRIQMLDGFNEGWIEFEGGIAGTAKGATDLEEVLQGLAEAARQDRDKAA
jgi:uncharacterized protein YbjT (DUF2867 family)